MGFLYKGRANKEDVTSLLIYLANKGYIKITEMEGKNLSSKLGWFRITKLKEYDGNNENERTFLEGLFKDSNTSFHEEVTSLDLYNKFYITMDKILSNINNKENTNKIFEHKASSKSKFIDFMIIATYCLITIPPILACGYDIITAIHQIFLSLFTALLGFTVMFSMLLGDKGNRITGLLIGGMVGGVPWAVLLLPILLQNPIYLIRYIVGFICNFGMVACLKYLPKRTPYGNEILGKLKGFKNFLEVAEKEKLEEMVMQDPTYFYDILPYTYVLGVSDKWIKKFETISLQAPTWYDSPNMFDIVTFETFMNHTMASAQKAMSSSPSSDSSSSGFSGGGFSGGGSGGGGGRSW